MCIDNCSIYPVTVRHYYILTHVYGYGHVYRHARQAALDDLMRGKTTVRVLVHVSRHVLRHVLVGAKMTVSNTHQPATRVHERTEMHACAADSCHLHKCMRMSTQA